MKSFLAAAFLFALVIGASAVKAQNATYGAYSVVNIQKTADNEYKAEVNIIRSADLKNTIPDGTRQFVVLDTKGCTHVPGNGAGAIVLIGPNGTSVQFSDGPVCTVSNVTTENIK